MRSAIAVHARYCKSRLILDGAIVLPLEGKGDRSAVDEVNCSPAPLRGASKNVPDITNRVPEAIANSSLLTPNSSFLTVFPFVTKKSRISKIPLTDK